MEFVEMPDLRLTSRQAARLWNLSQADCDELLAELVQQEFLWKTPEGSFLRRGSGSYRYRPSEHLASEERPQRWQAHFLEVRLAEGWEWATVALRGTPSYTVLLKISPRACAGDAAQALDAWLLNPGRKDGDVIEVM
jgi:hypothetical protein